MPAQPGEEGKRHLVPLYQASVWAPGPLFLGLFPASILPGDPTTAPLSPQGSGWAQPTSCFQEWARELD